MTIEEFEKKHGIDFKGDTLEEMMFFSALDKLYLEFTPEQTAEIIKDFLLYADDIYNDLAERTTKAIEQLKELFGSEPENTDNHYDA